MYRKLTTKGDKILNEVSSYRPNKAIKDITAKVLADYQQGLTTRNKGRTEFNGRNLITEVDVNQKRFNSYIPPESDNPDESWRAQTVRPITRNKLISIAAHVTSAILFPNVFARNEKDEEDRDSAEVMRILMEYTMDESNYAREFVNAVVTALVDPAVIIHAAFYDVMRKVKEMQADGSYTTKEILDEIMSGWRTNIVPCTELLIANIYEPNIQKQRFLCRTRRIDYKDAQALYGDHKNFKYVKPGFVNVFDEGTSTFYDVYDKDLEDYLVEETIYYNRAEDLQLTFVGGVLVCNPDYPNTRKDKRYPFAKSGYEPLNNGMFFYYKSAANKLGSDQDLVDTLYNMILDGTFLQLMPPMALYGREEVDSAVMVPGTITSFDHSDTKFESIAPRVDLRAGLETSNLVERSISESSQDNMRAGVAGEGGRTAREVMLTEQNARIALGLFGKMIGFLVEDIGILMVGDILQHMAMADVKELTGGSFKTFMIPDKNKGGRKVSEVVRFGLPETGKSEEDIAYELLAEEGGLRGNKKIYQVNPELFRNRKFKLKVQTDRMMPKSLALEKALGLEFYDRMIQNDIVTRAEVTRDLIELYKPGQSDKYIEEKQPTMPMEGQQPGEKFVQKGVNSNLVSQITGNNSLGVAASSDM